MRASPWARVPLTVSKPSPLSWPGCPEVSGASWGAGGQGTRGKGLWASQSEAPGRHVTPTLSQVGWFTGLAPQSFRACRRVPGLCSPWPSISSRGAGPGRLQPGRRYLSETVLQALERGAAHGASFSRPMPLAALRALEIQVPVRAAGRREAAGGALGAQGQGRAVSRAALQAQSWERPHDRLFAVWSKAWQLGPLRPGVSWLGAPGPRAGRRLELQGPSWAPGPGRGRCL